MQNDPSHLVSFISKDVQSPALHCLSVKRDHMIINTTVASLYHTEINKVAKKEHTHVMKAGTFLYQ